MQPVAVNSSSSSSGGAVDPYLHGLSQVDLPFGYRRMGAEVYWSVRRRYPNLVAWVENGWPGAVDDPLLMASSTVAAGEDSKLASIHARAGCRQ